MLKNKKYSVIFVNISHFLHPFAFLQSTVEGYYRGEGRFNNLKIKSKGYFNVTASKFETCNLIIEV